MLALGVARADRAALEAHPASRTVASTATSARDLTMARDSG
jgi:hypothetical protein